VERYLNTNEIAHELPQRNLKQKNIKKIGTKAPNFWLNVCQDWTLAREYDVDIYVENYPILSC
jgi:aspartate carbamoyltransferase regulatory subunit